MRQLVQFTNRAIVQTARQLPYDDTRRDTHFTAAMPSAIAIKQIEGKPGKVYYPLEKITIPEPKPKDNEVSFSNPYSPSPFAALLKPTQLTHPGRHNPHSRRPQPPRPLHPPTPVPGHNLRRPAPRRRRRTRHIVRPRRKTMAQQARHPQPRHRLARLPGRA
jgi:hypothetical protein